MMGFDLKSFYLLLYSVFYFNLTDSCNTTDLAVMNGYLNPSLLQPCENEAVVCNFGYHIENETHTVARCNLLALWNSNVPQCIGRIISEPRVHILLTRWLWLSAINWSGFSLPNGKRPVIAMGCICIHRNYFACIINLCGLFDLTIALTIIII